MTMQTLVVLLIGATYGWRLGAATVALYLAEGASACRSSPGRLPPGPAYMAGPTGGFLVGFLAAAIVTGYLAEHGWTGVPARPVAGMMAIGHAVIFAFGLGWLSSLMPLTKAWDVGAAPFVAGDDPEDGAGGRS